MLSLKIAFRYLFAKKSHNIINIISLISAIGIVIGSAALIIILSGYNGFNNLIKNVYNSYQADFIISPSKGKSFFVDTTLFKEIAATKGIAYIAPIVEENVFVKYSNNQQIAHIKGIDSTYSRVSGIVVNMVEGEFKTKVGEIDHAVLGSKLAMDLGVRVRFLDPLKIYFPKKGKGDAQALPGSFLFTALDPLSSLNLEKVFVSGVLLLEKSFDNYLIYLPIDVAQRLVSYSSNQVSSLELYLDGEAGQAMSSQQNYAKVEKHLRDLLKGNTEDLVLKNRFEQNATLYKLMQLEKFVIFLILFFVIIIVSINIFSSLSMLIIDKSSDIEILISMGADKKMLKNIFLFQGWMISVFGAATGVVIGVILSLMQQKFGLIALPGNFITDVFPVDVQLFDVVITFFSIIGIGYLIALLPSRTLK